MQINVDVSPDSDDSTFVRMLREDAIFSSHVWHICNELVRQGINRERVVVLCHSDPYKMKACTMDDEGFRSMNPDAVATVRRHLETCSEKQCVIIMIYDTDNIGAENVDIHTFEASES
jgi:hypothetical protein